MKRIVFIVLLLGLWVPRGLFAQAMFAAGTVSSTAEVPPPILSAYPDTQSLTDIGATADLPVMAPELALATYEQKAAAQATQLEAYSAVTTIYAQLPDTRQQGEFELQRQFNAPHTLLFKPIRFVGDKFVKANVITRLLQSEVDHLQKDDPSQTALTLKNYKFSYKGKADVDGHLVQVFQVKPRKKRVGLFKGRIYLEAHTGSLVRAEGKLVKSPSFFVKNIQFTQDYADIDSFTLPVHMHTEAKARIVGRTIIDIRHTDYQPFAVPTQAVLPTM
jgi:hypothetical protein